MIPFNLQCCMYHTLIIVVTCCGLNLIRTILFNTAYFMSLHKNGLNKCPNLISSNCSLVLCHFALYPEISPLSWSIPKSLATTKSSNSDRMSSSTQPSKHYRTSTYRKMCVLTILQILSLVSVNKFWKISLMGVPETIIILSLWLCSWHQKNPFHVSE